MTAPTADQLRNLLREKFGHDDFREGQLDAIEAVVGGRDAVVVMPTGGGKSLLYQLPALALPGVTVVVSPLIALMKDQVDQLVARGLPATFVNSTLAPGEQERRLEQAASGEIRLLYLAPERFKNFRFQAAVKRLKIALLAIDEAHCISEWGHDFRPDYRRLGEVRDQLGSPTVIALTATATPEVRGDIVRELRLRDPFTLVTGFERKNLYLEVANVSGVARKHAEIEATIAEAGGAGIVYVASRKSADEVAGWMSERFTGVGLYHAGLSDSERSRVQERFMSGELPYIVATNAFGMGIDRSDIRFVIHYEFPKSLEAYYQEVGRAGRDGRPARAKLLFTFADKRIQEFFIDGSNPQIDLVRAVYSTIVAAKTPPTSLAIAGSLGHKHDFAIASAVSLLERAGVIGSTAGGGRARALTVVKKLSPAALPIDGDLLARKLDSDRRMLEAVIQFAYHTGCRKERLLAYFGDTRRKRTCDACDRCITRGEVQRDLRDDEREIVQSCLAAASLVDKRMGLVKLATLLLGSPDDRFDHLGVSDSPSYGALRHLDRRAVLDWLSVLLDSGYLEKIDLDREGAYVIHLARKGRALLSSQGAITLSPPADRRRAPSARRERSPRPSTSAPTAGPIDLALLARLKQWRGEEAARRAVPAYVVFQNRVLEAIAATQPATASELSSVPGIGPSKLETYGEKVLALVRNDG